MLHVASSCQGGAYAGKWTVVVDDDIDAGDLDQVLWAMSTRFDPMTDVDTIQKAWASKRDPLFLPGNFNNRILIDACIPYDLYLKGAFPPVVDVSDEMRQTIKKKFSHLPFPKDFLLLRFSSSAYAPLDHGWKREISKSTLKMPDFLRRI